ncbi:fungal hydrophobin [Gyrodon lividus]|nr:fungal hydrophobin [Gyrodon lividus]
MLCRISALLAITLTTAASARLEHHIRTGSNSQCDTGNLRCCNSVANASNIASTLDFLGLPYNPSDSVGINCTPINVFGAGESSSCQQQPVCCTDNTNVGIYNVGCSPFDLN